ncbi:MAG: single-stranded DNA-binding protein [Candidatus Omnitrophota bacterium]|nr:single-stranded DNA-binding protein [Candidatus Omnitrophota bacterium]MBU1894366.1 single-stranded DNA-binding protein [Candidatus Omnitrophota bacterium]
MAASMNKVFLMGNLTRDPELRYVPSGSAVANFSVAVNRVYKDSTGERKEDTSFVRVVVWGKMAEICGEYLTKGRPVLVEGRLKSRTWEGQDGQKRSALDVVATSVQFLGARDKNQQARESVPGSNMDNSGNRNSQSAGYDEIDSIDIDAGSEGPIPF